MPTTVTATTLCICRHIHSMHNQGADCMLCRCVTFQQSSRTSSTHYRRGQATERRRVARLAEGDRILVVFADDGLLAPALSRTGALVATLTAPPVRSPGLGWSFVTNLGTVDRFLSGSYAVHVLTEVRIAPPPAPESEG